MTNRQAYVSLARIAAHHCYDDKKFVTTKRVGKEHLAVLQSKIMALLEKMDYARTKADFPDVYREAARARAVRQELTMTPEFFYPSNVTVVDRQA